MAAKPQQGASKGGAGAENRKRPPQGQRSNNGWIIPEGSAIYTAEGRMYEARRPERRQPPPQQGGRKNAGAATKGRQPSKGQPPRKRRKKKNIGAAILFWTRAFAIRLLIFFVITALVGLWWYRSEFYSNVGEGGEKVTYYVQNGSGTSITAGASTAWNGGVMYVNISALYPQFNMAAVGSLDSMRFIIKVDGVRDSSGDGSEQYVIFTDGSRTANVNGTAVVMEARCRVVGEDIWIPLSFMENYVDGIDIDHTSDDAVIFTSPDYLAAQKANKESKKPKKLNAADYPIEPSFRLARSNMLSPVSPID